MVEDSGTGGADRPDAGVEEDADVPTVGVDDAEADRLASGADASEDDDAADGSGHDVGGPSHALSEPGHDLASDEGEPVGLADAAADREQTTSDGDA